MATLYNSPISNPLTGPLVPQSVTLTDGATIALDASLGEVFIVTLGGNRTLAAPTNALGGQRLTLIVKQDGTGSRTLTFNAAFVFAGTVTLDTVASHTTVYEFVYDAAAAKWQCICATANVGAAASVASIISGTVTIASGASTGTASVGTAYNGKTVLVSLSSATGALHGTFIPAFRGVVSAGTLTITSVDKNNAAANVSSDVVVSYIVDGR